MRRPVFFLAFLTLLPMRAFAQESRPTASGVNISPAIGLHFGSPMRFSLALGALVDLKGRRDDGIVVLAEPGQHGNEVAIGYFRMLGRFGSGYSVRAAALRTGGDPWNASAHTTYAGVEGQWMIALGAGGRIGYLRRVSRSLDTQRDHLATVGLVIGI